MKKLMKRFKNERGLTLVELLAVVVILAIISVIAFVMISKVIDNSKKDAHIANAQQLIASAKLYHASGGKENTIESSVLNDEGFVDELIDPWKGEGDYSGTVTYDPDKKEYKVTMTGGSGDCTISEEVEKDLSEGREKICP